MRKRKKKEENKESIRKNIFYAPLDCIACYQICITIIIICTVCESDSAELIVNLFIIIIIIIKCTNENVQSITDGC